MNAGLASIRLSLLLLIAVAGGCAAGRGAEAFDARDAWAHNHGGVVIDPARQARAEQALARVAPALPTSLSIAMLGSEQPGAFSWPSGAIFVTRSLVDLADDDELAAALAHEAGHLLADDSATSALAGTAQDHDCREHAESMADDTGRTLLRAADIDDTAMVRLLKKVAWHPTTPTASRDALLRRIARLHRPEP